MDKAQLWTYYRDVTRDIDLQLSVHRRGKRELGFAVDRLVPRLEPVVAEQLRRVLGNRRRGAGAEHQHHEGNQQAMHACLRASTGHGPAPPVSDQHRTRVNVPARKSVVEGKRWSVRVDLCCPRFIKTKQINLI